MRRITEGIAGHRQVARQGERVIRVQVYRERDLHLLEIFPGDGGVHQGLAFADADQNIIIPGFQDDSLLHVREFPGPRQRMGFRLCGLIITGQQPDQRAQENNTQRSAKVMMLHAHTPS